MNAKPSRQHKHQPPNDIDNMLPLQSKTYTDAVVTIPLYILFKFIEKSLSFSFFSWFFILVYKKSSFIKKKAIGVDRCHYTNDKMQLK